MAFTDAQTVPNIPKNLTGSLESGDSGDIEDGSCAVKSLFGRLIDAGVVLSIDADGLLVIDAPVGVLADSAVAELRAHRDDLLSLVERWTERAAVREHDGGLSQSEAERLALVDVMGGGDDPAVACEPLGPACVCPWCLSGDRLADDPGGLWCGRCDRLSWRWVGDSIERCDWFEPVVVDAIEPVETNNSTVLPRPKKKRPAVFDAAGRSLFGPTVESG